MPTRFFVTVAEDHVLPSAILTLLDERYAAASLVAVFQGAWDADAEYAEGEMVTFGGGLYYAPEAIAAGVEPGTAPWLLMVVGGADGQDGAAGSSAYQIAVANGFVGDEASWLASLVGQDGTDGQDGAGFALPEDGSVAIGTGATATPQSVSIGEAALASGPVAVAIGAGAEAGAVEGGPSVAVGHLAMADRGTTEGVTRVMSTAVGHSAVADGLMTIALGANAVAGGNFSAMVGTGTNEADNTIKFGYHTLILDGGYGSPIVLTQRGDAWSINGLTLPQYSGDPTVDGDVPLEVGYTYINTWGGDLALRVLLVKDGFDSTWGSALIVPEIYGESVLRDAFAQGTNTPSGETTGRPVGPGLAVGYSFFDVTLGKPVWLKTYEPATYGDDDVWVDATGATV